MVNNGGQSFSIPSPTRNTAESPGPGPLPLAGSASKRLRLCTRTPQSPDSCVEEMRSGGNWKVRCLLSRKATYLINCLLSKKKNGWNMMRKAVNRRNKSMDNLNSLGNWRHMWVYDQLKKQFQVEVGEMGGKPRHIYRLVSLNLESARTVRTCLGLTTETWMMAQSQCSLVVHTFSSIKSWIYDIWYGSHSKIRKRKVSGHAVQGLNPQIVAGHVDQKQKFWCKISTKHV